MGVGVGGTLQISFPRQHKKIRPNAHKSVSTGILTFYTDFLYRRQESGAESIQFHALGNGWAISKTRESL